MGGCGLGRAMTNSIHVMGDGAKANAHLVLSLAGFREVKHWKMLCLLVITTICHESEAFSF